MRNLKLYQDLHYDGGFEGTGLVQHIPEIVKYFDQFKVQTVLDYGSGKAQHLLRLPYCVRAYDPGYGPLSLPPKGYFNAVICCEVMEHVPEEEVEGVYDEISRYAQMCVFFVINLKPTEDNNGEIHCTLRPREWWIQQWGVARTPAKFVFTGKGGQILE